MRTRVKICGITRPEDAATAVAAGVDAVGVIFYPPSPRSADMNAAAAIRAVVPAFVDLVLVTVDLDLKQHQAWIHALEPDVLQFHGEEAPEYCERFGRPYIKTLRMRKGVDAARYSRSYASARGILMDTFVDGVVGGTGRKFDWSLSSQVKDKPVILAGGIAPDNVGEAISSAHPYAVDVSSSLESSPGVKQTERIWALLNAVRLADAVNQPGN